MELPQSRAPEAWSMDPHSSHRDAVWTFLFIAVAFLVSSPLGEIHSAFIFNATRMSSPGWLTPGHAHGCQELSVFSCFCRRKKSVSNPEDDWL